jgi:predicted nuclease of predicted toxin-antitoxin system
VKILLDECIDQRLAEDFTGHEVLTVAQVGWKSKQNGELLTLAADHFEAFVTTDRNLSFPAEFTAVQYRGRGFNRANQPFKRP